MKRVLIFIGLKLFEIIVNPIKWILIVVGLCALILILIGIAVQLIYITGIGLGWIIHLFTHNELWNQGIHLFLFTNAKSVPQESYLMIYGAITWAITGITWAIVYHWDQITYTIGEWLNDNWRKAGEIANRKRHRK